MSSSKGNLRPPRTPWVVITYIFLLFFFSGLLLATFYFDGKEKAHDLFDLASNGLQLILGGLLGALAWAAENFFRGSGS